MTAETTTPPPAKKKTTQKTQPYNMKVSLIRNPSRSANYALQPGLQLAPCSLLLWSDALFEVQKKKKKIQKNPRRWCEGWEEKIKKIGDDERTRAAPHRGMNLSKIAPSVSRTGEHLAHLKGSPIMPWDKIQTNKRNGVISGIFFFHFWFESRIWILILLEHNVLQMQTGVAQAILF